MLEKNKEKKFSQWATDNGWLVRKIKYVSRNGALDRLYMKSGIVAFIEWKKDASSEIQESQRLEIPELDSQFIFNIVTYDVEIAKKFLSYIDSERPRLLSSKWVQVFNQAKEMCSLDAHGIGKNRISLNSSVISKK